MTKESNSTKTKLMVFALITAGTIAFWFWMGWWGIHQSGETVRDMSFTAAKVMEKAAELQLTQNHPGIPILKNYSSASSRPEDDLQAMAHAFSNLLLLAKGDAPFRMGANEEFAAALLGKNSAKEVFLKAPHPCLNDKAQLIDRWGTPLFFHVRDASRIDIRSAGADQEMWTPDDLQRRYDGEFYRGDDLPEPKEK